jgi:hypothetical protein
MQMAKGRLGFAMADVHLLVSQDLYQEPFVRVTHTLLLDTLHQVAAQRVRRRVYLVDSYFQI